MISTKETLDSLIRGATDFVRHELPQLNRAAEESGDATLVISAAEPLLARVKTYVANPDVALTRRAALRLLQLVSFVVSSAERHLQTAREPAGAAVIRLSMTETLVRLGRIARHNPRDSHISLWLDNRRDPLTFRGGTGEVLFNENVNITQDFYEVSASTLYPIGNGDVPLSSEAAHDAILFAKVNVERVHFAYRRFMESALLTPDDFFRFRQYLTKYPVEGRMWSGPNAANIIGQVQLDYTIGTVEDFYKEVIAARWDLWSDEERMAVSTDMARPSLFTQLLSGLRIADEAQNLTINDLVMAMQERPEYLPAAEGIAKLVAEAAHLSAYHFALIANYLMKPKFPPEMVENAIVPPTLGTGAHNHDETRRIMEMRTKHPLGAKIVAAVATISKKIAVPVNRS